MLNCNLFIFTVIGSLAYYFVGYSFSFGEPGNAFIGHSQFFATNLVSPTVNGTQAVRSHQYTLAVPWYGLRQSSMHFHAHI